MKNINEWRGLDWKKSLVVLLCYMYVEMSTTCASENGLKFSEVIKGDEWVNSEYTDGLNSGMV